MLCERIIFSKNNPSRANQISNYLVTENCSSLIDAKEEILRKVDYAQDEITPYLDTQQKLTRYFEFFNTKIYLAIITITIVASVFFLIMVYIAKFLVTFKHANLAGNVYIFAISGVFSAFFATWICGKFAVMAEGSGIAEMKSILTGIQIQDFFTIKTLLTKYFSCIFVKVSGLGMGYEGAFIHIIGAFSYNITKLPYFKELNDDHNRKLITLAGISASLVLAFGTPIGAMIFAIDMCPVNFQLPTLFKCFISVSVAYFIYCLTYNIFTVSSVAKMNPYEYKIGEIYWFILLGLVEGTLCTVYLIAYSKYLVYKRCSKKIFFADRYYYIGIVTCLIAFLTYGHNNFRFGIKEIVSDLTSLEDLHDVNRKVTWWYNDVHAISELIYVLIGRIAMFWSFSSSAIPFGVFGPGLTIGCILGRLFGEVVCRLVNLSTRPNVFAACGCAAFLCGFTRSFAPMICVIEMTGEVRLLLPMLITNLIGFLFSSVWNIGFFEMLIAIRRLPYLPTFMLPEKGLKSVTVISEKIGTDFLNQDSTLQDIFNMLILKTEVSNNEYIPIIDRKTRRIHSYVKLENCFNYLKSISIDIESILTEHRFHMSHQLYINLKQFVIEYGVDAHLMISKRIWGYLKNIRMKTNKFVIGQFGSTFVKKPEPLLNRQIDNYSRFPNEQSLESEKISYAFEMDFLKREKVKFEEQEMQRKVITELLANIRVAWDDCTLDVVRDPIIVNLETSLMKAHYMFLMLGVPVLWVQEFNGELVAKLTKDAFLKFKSQ